MKKNLTLINKKRIKQKVDVDLTQIVSLEGSRISSNIQRNNELGIYANNSYSNLTSPVLVWRIYEFHNGSPRLCF